MRADDPAYRQSMLIRSCNGVGRLLERAGLDPVDLDADSLLRAARRRTGLEDFGDEAFLEPMRLLLHSYENEAHLSFAGRLAARSHTLQLLGNRLRLVAERKRSPGIAEQRIKAPWFIIGLPRTGTTLLFGLLAQDPANRLPLTWEVMMPCPAPERASYETDPRIRRTARLLRWVDRLTPQFKLIHPIGAQLPQECIAITTHAFTSIEFHTTHDVPTYQAWLEQQDCRAAYRFHSEFLQHLQYRCPGEQWVLKAPGHLFALDALLDTYPDARIIQTHRDPLKVAASIASLTVVLRSAFSDEVDRRHTAADWSRLWALALNHTLRTRTHRALDTGQILDIHFPDLVRDPIATVKSLYRHFGRSLDAEAEARMRRFLSANPNNRHGTHRYSLSEFGLDPERERARYQAYTAHFGIRPEAAR